MSSLPDHEQALRWALAMKHDLGKGIAWRTRLLPEPEARVSGTGGLRNKVPAGIPEGNKSRVAAFAGRNLGGDDDSGEADRRRVNVENKPRRDAESPDASSSALLHAQRAAALRADLLHTRKNSAGETYSAWSLWEHFVAERKVLARLDPEVAELLEEVDEYIVGLQRFEARLRRWESSAEGLDGDKSYRKSTGMPGCKPEVQPAGKGADLDDCWPEIRAGQRGVQGALSRLVARVRALGQEGTWPAC